MGIEDTSVAASLQHSDRLTISVEHEAGPKNLTRYSAIVGGIHNGIMAALRGDLRWAVWCSLANHLPDVRPSLALIAKEVGIAERAVKARVKQLRDAKLIVGVETRRAADGTVMPNRYYLADVTDPDVVKAVKSLARKQSDRRRTCAPGLRASKSRGADRYYPGAHLRPGIRTEKKNSSSRADDPLAAAGDSDEEPDPAIVEALILAEISEPTRSELARAPGVTAALVRRVAAEAEARGKGIGAVVQGIRAAAEASVKRRQRAEARKRAEADLAERRHRQAELEKANVAHPDDRRRYLQEIKAKVGLTSR